MRFKTAIGGSVLIGGLFSNALAVPPPLDRPTPPPCCADGHCHPNPLTFGWYETRWRRWPLEYGDAVPAGAPSTTELKKEIPAFETPPAEQEDQQAPPPTTPPAEENPPPPPPAATQNGAAQGRQPAQPPTAAPPQTPPQTPPQERTGPRRTLPPYEPQTPRTQPLNNGGPMGESDPPPALPFGPGRVNASQPVREASHPITAPIRVPAKAASESQSDDPPPNLPVTLASWSE